MLPKKSLSSLAGQNCLTNHPDAIIALEDSKLARQISSLIDRPLFVMSNGYHRDGELKVDMAFSAPPQVILLASAATPFNDFLLRTAIALRRLKRAGVQHITLIAPYLPYGRQHDIIGGLFEDFLQTAGADLILTVDVHQHTGAAGVINVLPLPLLGEIAEPYDLLIAPDHGAGWRTQQAASYLQLDWASMSKTRAGQLITFQLDKAVEGKNCLIYDDIIDTACTVTQAAQFLLARGARTVSCFASHLVLGCSGACRSLQDSCLKAIYTTDSIQQPPLERIKVLSLAPQLFSAYASTAVI